MMSTNYTVMVHRTGEVGRILDLKLEYFIILTVSVLCVFIISVLCIVLVCAFIARKTILKNQKSPVRTITMPRKIKMGTCSSRVLDYTAPDIISDVSNVYQSSRHRSDTSSFSLDTATTAVTAPTPASLNSSTNAVIQPSVPISQYSRNIE